MIYRSLNNKEGSINSANSSLSIPSNLSAGGIAGGISSIDIIPMFKRFFDIVTIKYFTGPLYDLLINRILDRLDMNDGKDLALIKTIIECEHILLKEGVLENNYALIIARKKSE